MLADAFLEGAFLAGAFLAGAFFAGAFFAGAFFTGAFAADALRAPAAFFPAATLSPEAFLVPDFAFAGTRFSAMLKLLVKSDGCTLHAPTSSAIIDSMASIYRE